MLISDEIRIALLSGDIICLEKKKENLRAQNGIFPRTDDKWQSTSLMVASLNNRTDTA